MASSIAATMRICIHIPGIRHTRRPSASRRWLSNASKTKKRRKRVLTNQDKQAATTKTRLRQRLDKPNRSLVNPETVDLLSERMTTRLEWAQGQLQSFWKDNSHSRRPERYELAMDINWWFWNLLLMASPGLMIAAYCGLVVKPQMIKQQRDQEAQTGSMSPSGILPPAAPSNWKDSFQQLADYLQGRVHEETSDTVPSERVPKSLQPLTSQQQLQKQQLEALKQQLQELEAQMTNSSTLPPTPRRVSPIEQRRYGPRSGQQPPSHQTPMEQTAPAASTKQAGFSVPILWSGVWESIQRSFGMRLESKGKEDSTSTSNGESSASQREALDDSVEEQSPKTLAQPSPAAAASSNGSRNVATRQVPKMDKKDFDGLERTNSGFPKAGDVSNQDAPPPSTSRPWWKLW